MFISQVIIPQVFFLLFYFSLFFYSTGTQHGNLHPAGWPVLSCGPTQEPVLPAANKGKTTERFCKNAGEWSGKVKLAQYRLLRVRQTAATPKRVMHPGKTGTYFNSGF